MPIAGSMATRRAIRVRREKPQATTVSYLGFDSGSENPATYYVVRAAEGTRRSHADSRRACWSQYVGRQWKSRPPRRNSVAMFRDSVSSISFCFLTQTDQALIGAW